MTRLQISRNEWWEAKRHNAAQEAEQSRHNLEQEALSREANANTRAANEEIARANRAKEELTAAEIAVKQQTAQETVRADLAREAENLRHNATSEKIDRANNRMNNSREWAKINLTQQRQEIQNYSDLANARLHEIEALLKQAEVEADLPQAKVDQIRSDIEYQKAMLQLSNDRFSAEKGWKERELTVAEKRQKSDEMLNQAKSIEAVTKSAANIADVIGGLVNENPVSLVTKGGKK